ncbi:hypothetical protein LWF01_12010 [Saxibacter everestensis]|uniref:Histidine kinase n=1 Tax=Saxibacter everestensis TaxID=2909229 RepID=A0ABY8QPE1_9MICO|nr:hypothetical protein LWF01_12010 [Brevibacteriaceae bacterium ZFBP1038]
MSTEPPVDRQQSPTPARRPFLLVIIVAIVALEAGAMLGAAGWLMYSLVTAPTTSVSSAIALFVLVLVLGVGLLFVARALWQGLRWPRAAAIVWQLLVASVAIPTMTGGQPGLGIALLIPGIVVVAGLFVPSVAAATRGTLGSRKVL